MGSAPADLKNALTGTISPIAIIIAMVNVT
jgi:hypothetical protein